MKIPLPQTNRQRALIVVDVQPAFLDTRNAYITKNIIELIRQSPYDLYVTAVFSVEKGSLWEKQRGVIFPKDKTTKTVKEIDDLLINRKLVQIHKDSRSVFRGDVDLRKLLNDEGIEEVHIVGTQTNDCILASAFDAFDSGFFSYVIEECCEGSTEELHSMGLALLRRQKMTNHSYLEL